MGHVTGHSALSKPKDQAHDKARQASTVPVGTDEMLRHRVAERRE